MAENDRQSDWTDRIVGARMTIDDRYASTVEGSRFSRQEWGLIMTAVEFEIEHAADDERARLVADTSGLSAVMPELERVRNSQGGMGGGTSSRRSGESGGSGGFLGSMKDALGLGGGGVDPEETEAAEELAAGYAAELQSYLEEQGRWEEVRAAYREAAGNG
jgi:hypothetical protein